MSTTTDEAGDQPAASQSAQEPANISGFNLTATFDNPGMFPKYLTMIDGHLVFLDLIAVATVYDKWPKLIAKSFEWILDLNFHLSHRSSNKQDFLPPARPFPNLSEKVKLKYTINVNGCYVLVDLKYAGQLSGYDHCPVDFGPYTVDEQFRVWAMSDQHKAAISDAAE